MMVETAALLRRVAGSGRMEASSRSRGISCGTMSASMPYRLGPAARSSPPPFYPPSLPGPAYLCRKLFALCGKGLYAVPRCNRCGEIIMWCGEMIIWSGQADFVVWQND
jgi:hypothetical protein